jgi:hypothetical protein
VGVAKEVSGGTEQRQGVEWRAHCRLGVASDSAVVPRGGRGHDVTRRREARLARPTGRNVVVRAEHLTKRFGELVAVDDLSFVLERGTVTGFLGPNGAGKTTTLRMLLHLVEPTVGRALVFAAHYQDLERPAERVGAVLEAADFHPGRSGRDHLVALALALGRDAAGDQSCVQRASWTSARASLRWSACAPPSSPLSPTNERSRRPMISSARAARRATRRTQPLRRSRRGRARIRRCDSE